MNGEGTASGTLARDAAPVGLRWGAVELARALGQSHAPTPEQVAVIEAPLRPLLVVAGAGSGKTETMAARVVWLVANHLVRPDEVLGLTFTRKAAGELSERLTTRLATLHEAGLWAPSSDDGAAVLDDVPTVSTYHAYAGRIVREHGVRLGVEAESRLLSEAAAWQVAHEAVASWDGPMDGVEKAESTVTTAVVDLAGEMAEHLVGVDAVARHLDEVMAALEAVPSGVTKRRTFPSEVRDAITVLRERRAVLPLVERYHELKRRRDAMDFADQVALAARIATTVPQVGVAERARFRAVLLDEFQDTSEAQLQLLRSLFVAPGSPVPVTAVGDPHQSIYGWRGASSTTLHRFREDFVDPDPPLVLPLSTSWRNDRAVLDVANLVAGPRPARPGCRSPRWRHAARPGGATSPRPASRRSRRRPRTWPPGWSTAAPGRGDTPQRCCAASVPSSTRWSRRSRRAASPMRSSGSAGSSTRPRWPTSSRCCGSCRTRPVATVSCACSPGRRAGRGRRPRRARGLGAGAAAHRASPWRRPRTRRERPLEHRRGARRPPARDLGR